MRFTSHRPPCPDEEPGRGKNRSFDDSQYTQYKKQSNEYNDREQVLWQPYSDFETFWLIRGKSPDWIEAKWIEETTERPTRTIRGHVCLAKFGGSLEELVAQTKTVSRYERSCKPTTGEQVQDLRQAGVDLLDMERRELQRRLADRSGPLVDAGAGVAQSYDLIPAAGLVKSSAVDRKFESELKRKAADQDEQEDQHLFMMFFDFLIVLQCFVLKPF